jgi:hypothetical protein
VTATQYPVVLAGQRLTAAVLQAFAPIRAVKASDSSAVTNSTTLVSDTELVIPVVSGRTYDLDGWIIWVGNDTGDIKFAFDAPTGSTLDWGILGGDDTDTTFATGNTRGRGEWFPRLNSTSFPTSTVQFSASTAAIFGILRGRLVAGATGNLTLKFAQNTSNGTGTLLKAGSWIHAQTVA